MWLFQELWLVVVTAISCRVVRLLPGLVACAAQVGLMAPVSAQSGSGGVRGGLSRSEVLQMPQFCWSEFIPGLNSAEFRINASACPNSNHYCAGLLDLTRAKKMAVSDRNRATRLRVARDHVIYTLKGTAAFPACPIRPHVQQSLLEIDAMLGQVPKSAR